MKELTIKEKAEAYDEALERVNKLQKTCDSTTVIGWCEYIFPELRESEDERIRKALIGFFNRGAENGEQTNGVYDKDILAWLEKQGNEKPAIFVSKFHEGDWIVQENIGVYKVIEICESWYEVVDGEDNHYSISFDKEYMCRLWDIAKDAKDGDAIQLGGVTAIFKEYISNPYCKCYCSVYDEEFGIPRQDGEDNIYGCTNATPATKEQRDLLFQKMKEAGYEWDSEKKELKKIEHTCKLDNSYDHVTFPFKAKVKSSGTIVTIHGGQLNQGGGEWIKYQSDVKDGFRVYEANDLELVCEIEPTSAWNEEDEKMIWAIPLIIKNYPNQEMFYGYNKEKLISWIKSLKERYAWKPNDEQIEALEHFVRSIGESGFASPYDSNTKLVYSLLSELKKL